MTAVDLELPPKLIPVFSGDARYRGSFGGRGSGKTRSFAKMAAVRGLMFAQAGVKGLIVCGREFMNSLADSSFAEVVAAIESEPWLKSNYEIGRNYVRTKCGRVEFAFIGMRHNLESIKSKARILILWVDEAEQVSESAWIIAVPTVREHNSEIWVTWNPARKTSATHRRFREDPPEGAKIVELNYTDNPWFPDVLERERLEDLAKRPEHYAHIWEGDFASSVDGAYYARLLQEAKEQGRIGHVGRDPLMQVRSYHDIGGAGRMADAYTIWIAQFVGQEIRVLDYYESVGQTLESHVAWMRERGWAGAEVILPHDGVNANAVTGKQFADHWRDAGFQTRIIPNQGRGAARQRIEAVRRLLPSMWFNAETTEAGREALAFYHEKKDEAREVGLGPTHDWCLAAGAEVLTPDGWRRVESINPSDLVVTPCGARRVLRAGVVRHTEEWVEVNGIVCTPEHRFFTSRGLVEAGALSSEDELWTRGSLGLRILAFLSATFRFGLKTAITLATREGNPEKNGPRSSFIAWSMRLCMAASRRGMRSITSTAILSTIIPPTLRPLHGLNTGVCTNRSTDSFALAGYAGGNSAATRSLALDAAKNAERPTTRALNVSGGRAPAYNLSVETDECYFVRGDDGRAYLVSNSSHSADAFGLLAIDYKPPSNFSLSGFQPRAVA